MIEHYHLTIVIGKHTFYKKFFSEYLMYEAVKDLLENQVEFTVKYIKGKENE